MQFRTDLALESCTFSGKKGEIPGISFEKQEREGFLITKLKILNETGEKELCKPRGTYVTIETVPMENREDRALENGQTLVAEVLRSLLPGISHEPVLVCGLGNENITPDALGPKTVRKVLATRHLVGFLQEAAPLRPVSVLETGVLGTTGLESCEMIRAVCRFLHPCAVLAIDALASADVSHVCRTIQISDAGIVPGSGVGNDRKELSLQTLGIPVIAMGVPTVMDAISLTREISGSYELKNRKKYESFYITPKNIDLILSEMTKVLGGGINRALQPRLSPEEIELFLG